MALSVAVNKDCAQNNIWEYCSTKANSWFNKRKVQHFLKDKNAELI